MWRSDKTTWEQIKLGFGMIYVFGKKAIEEGFEKAVSFVKMVWHVIVLAVKVVYYGLKPGWTFDLKSNRAHRVDKVDSNND